MEPVFQEDQLLLCACVAIDLPELFKGLLAEGLLSALPDSQVVQWPVQGLELWMGGDGGLVVGADTDYGLMVLAVHLVHERWQVGVEVCYVCGNLALSLFALSVGCCGLFGQLDQLVGEGWWFAGVGFGGVARLALGLGEGLFD